MHEERNGRGTGGLGDVGEDLRRVRLERIVIPDGFNPRGGVLEDRELAALAASIRRHGVLQPLRVRATDHGDLVLIAGERRYRAARAAGVSEVPVIVRPAGAGDDAEEADLLVEAVIENDVRVDLDPLARARGYQRLLDGGLTVRGVAEQLGVTQARVKDHLRILKLPAGVQKQVGGGDVPLRAVKALQQLAQIHPALAQTAVAGIVQSDSDEQEPFTWGDVERDPLAVALAVGELPDEVYEPHRSYPVERFDLGEKAGKDFEELVELLGSRPQIRFGAAEIEQARALGAAHGERCYTVIVGRDVASQLAGDWIARCLKTQRANDRRRRQNASAEGNSAAGGNAAADQNARADAARAERETAKVARERATAFNLELGRLIFTTLAKIKVDERAMKLLASVEVTARLGDLAMRGARYGFPGWVTETTAANGRTKLSYIEQRAALADRATAYLALAESPGEIAGRQLALVVFAVYADQDAVATSNRSWYQPERHGPWAGEFDELLDSLVREKLPAAAIALLEPHLKQRAREREQLTADRAARAQATARLDGIEERIATLQDPELAAAERDIALTFSRWEQRGRDLTRLIHERRAELRAGVVAPLTPLSETAA